MLGKCLQWFYFIVAHEYVCICVFGWVCSQWLKALSLFLFIFFALGPSGRFTRSDDYRVKLGIILFRVWYTHTHAHISMAIRTRKKNRNTHAYYWLGVRWLLRRENWRLTKSRGRDACRGNTARGASVVVIWTGYGKGATSLVCGRNLIYQESKWLVYTTSKRKSISYFRNM